MSLSSTSLASTSPSSTSPSSKRVRLVSTFGLGMFDRDKKIQDYKASKYQWDGQVSSETKHVQRALAEIFSVTSIGGVTTPQVCKSWIQFASDQDEHREYLGDRLGRESDLWSSLSNT